MSEFRIFWRAQYNTGSEALCNLGVEGLVSYRNLLFEHQIPMEGEMGRLSMTVSNQADERIRGMVDLGEERKDTKAVTVGSQSDGSFWRPEFQEWLQLLPGLPTELTLHQIVSKLPWSSFTVLSSVSRGWLAAIESRQIFHARVRSHSTETFVVIHSVWSGVISLYSTRSKLCYRLPQIPNVEREVAQFSGIASVDGKIYVLGEYVGSKNVCV